VRELPKKTARPRNRSPLRSGNERPVEEIVASSQTLKDLAVSLEQSVAYVQSPGTQAERLPENVNETRSAEDSKAVAEDQITDDKDL
jgi:hypothetical protein